MLILMGHQDPSKSVSIFLRGLRVVYLEYRGLRVVYLEYILVVPTTVHPYGWSGLSLAP